MYSFNILTWNSGDTKDRYLASLDNILFGGSSGHAAAELIIPATDENEKLIEALDKNHKLIVKKETMPMTQPSKSDDGYTVAHVPCLKIYFSFLGMFLQRKHPKGIAWWMKYAIV